MDKANISVVIPLYNKESSVTKTLGSIKAQTLAAMEIIIVDDGSTDKSADRVIQFARNEGSRMDIRLIRTENKGVSSARNLGISLAKGDYVAFIDADDLWEKGFLEEINLLINNYPQCGAFATAYHKLAGPSQRLYPKIRFPQPQAERGILADYFDVSSRGDLPFIVSSICIRKALLDKLSGFRVDQTMGEDQDLWSRLALCSQYAYSRKNLSYYCLDAENRACVANFPSKECPFSIDLQKYIDENNLDSKLKLSIKRYIAANLLYIAKMHLKTGNLSLARPILNDPRARAWPLKWLALRSYSVFQSFILQSANTASSTN